MDVPAPAMYSLYLGPEQMELFREIFTPTISGRGLSDRPGDAFILTLEEWSKMTRERDVISRGRRPDGDPVEGWRVGPGDGFHLMYIEGVGVARPTTPGEQIKTYVTFKNSGGTGRGRHSGMNYEPGRIRVDVELLEDWGRSAQEAWRKHYGIHDVARPGVYGPELNRPSDQPHSVLALVFDPDLATSECKGFYDTWKRLQREADKAVQEAQIFAWRLESSVERQNVRLQEAVSKLQRERDELRQDNDVDAGKEGGRRREK